MNKHQNRQRNRDDAQRLDDIDAPRVLGPDRDPAMLLCLHSTRLTEAEIKREVINLDEEQHRHGIQADLFFHIRKKHSRYENENRIVGR